MDRLPQAPLMRTSDARDDTSGRPSWWVHTGLPVAAGAATGIVGAQLVPGHQPLVLVAVTVGALASSLIARRRSRT